MSREWNWVLVISFTILHLSSSQQNSSAPRSVLASLPPSSEATTPPAVSSAPAASSEPNSSAASTAVPSPVPTTVPNTDYPVERCGPLYGNIWCPAGSMGQTLYCSKWGFCGESYKADETAGLFISIDTRCDSFTDAECKTLGANFFCYKPEVRCAIQVTHDQVKSNPLAPQHSDGSINAVSILSSFSLALLLMLAVA